MRSKRSLAVGIIGVLAIAGLPTGSHAQTTPPAAGAKILGQPCNLLHDLVPVSDSEPTKFKLTPVLAPEFVPGKNSLDKKFRDKLLSSGLPCHETVSGNGPEGSKNTALENRQRGFDYYSWLTFIALNSPVDRPIDQSAPDTRTQWESRKNFMHLLDVMIKDPVPGKNEPKWGERVIPKECVSKYKDTVKDINDMMVIEMIEETFNEPFKTGALIDQQGNYALFDILMNKQMFDFIKENKLYSKAEQQANAGLKIDFPSGFNPEKDKNTGDPGAIMIKVSWKVIESEKEKGKFHTVDALVLMPRHDEKIDKSEPPCLRKTLGLVGFHVGHKTAARRQWIWTSFEHVDNVPEEQEIKSGKLRPSYNFYKKCQGACPANNQTPPFPWEPTYANGLKFHDPSFRSQITRVIPLTDETKDMNTRFQAVLGNTVWKNYMLLSTQWPSDFDCSTSGDRSTPPGPGRTHQPTDFNKQPDMNCAATPTFLANSTLETYSQGKVPLASSSCMACHGNAVSHQRRSADADPNAPDTKFFNQSDFTFMLEKAR